MMMRLANITLCPICHKNQLKDMGMRIFGGMLYRNLKCDDCGLEYSNVYRISYDHTTYKGK